MSDITFLNAKNGSLTCCANGIFLHSKYNPEQEASRFVQSIQCSFNPKYIVITEPALFHAKVFIKERFPQAKIIIIRYTDKFNQYNPLDCKILYSRTEAESQNAERELFSVLGQQGALSTLFLSWKPSSNLFLKEDELTWKMLKSFAEKSRTILFTEGYFSKRWLINSITFLINIKKTVKLKKIEYPVVIAASGPSLKPLLHVLKDIQNSVFIIALSSATATLLYSGIRPDLVLSTDGGFWAKKHLEPLFLHPELPLALPNEGALPSKLLTNANILPLVYPDGTESELTKKIIPFAYNAARNGTVSGTAVEFALSITNKPIFALGLDLCSSSGFQHTQPNMLETLNSTKDTKIFTPETRQESSRCNSESLKIYQEWFIQNSTRLSERLYRVYNTPYKNFLGAIKDIPVADFVKIIKSNKNQKSKKAEDFFYKTDSVKLTKKERAKIIKDYIEQIPKEQFLERYFPAEYASYTRAQESQKEEWKNILEERNIAFRKKLDGLIKDYL